MRLRRTAVLLLAAWASLSGSAVAAACPRTTEVALENKIMCQVCGVPLALANSLEADRERALITQLVSRCESASQIEAAMVAQYGPSILATPGTHGFAIAAWLVPGLGIAVAALAVAGVLASAKHLHHAGHPAPHVTEADDARLNAALAAYPSPSRSGPDGLVGPTDAAAGGPTQT